MVCLVSLLHTSTKYFKEYNSFISSNTLDFVVVTAYGV